MEVGRAQILSHYRIVIEELKQIVPKCEFTLIWTHCRMENIMEFILQISLKFINFIKL